MSNGPKGPERSSALYSGTHCWAHVVSGAQLNQTLQHNLRSRDIIQKRFLIPEGKTSGTSDTVMVLGHDIQMKLPIKPVEPATVVAWYPLQGLEVKTQFNMNTGLPWGCSLNFWHSFRVLITLWNVVEYKVSWSGNTQEKRKRKLYLSVVLEWMHFSFLSLFLIKTDVLLHYRTASAEREIPCHRDKLTRSLSHKLKQLSRRCCCKICE